MSKSKSLALFGRLFAERTRYPPSISRRLAHGSLFLCRCLLLMPLLCSSRIHSSIPFHTQLFKVISLPSSGSNIPLPSPTSARLPRSFSLSLSPTLILRAHLHASLTRCHVRSSLRFPLSLYLSLSSLSFLCVSHSSIVKTLARPRMERGSLLSCRWFRGCLDLKLGGLVRAAGSSHPTTAAHHLSSRASIIPTLTLSHNLDPAYR